MTPGKLHHELVVASAVSGWFVARTGGVYRFLRHHRVVASVVSGALVVVLLGHHELAWLCVAINYDKVFSALFPAE